MTGNGYDTPDEAVLADYPAGQVLIIGARAHGDHAIVLVDARPNGPPYLYEEKLIRRDGRWSITGGSSAGGWGWYATNEDGTLGVVSFADSEQPGVDAVLVSFGNLLQIEPVVHGSWLSVWWDQPYDETWPRVLAYRLDGVWIKV